MGIYQETKCAAELISFLSAPVVAFFAWKMLGQLKIGSNQVKAAVDQILTAKNISQIQSKRESIKIAAEQSVFYAEKIIPEMEKILKLKNEKKFPILSNAEVVEDWPNIQCKTDNLPGLIKEVESNTLILKTLNQLEGLAMFFVCGVADTNAAYRPLCSTFCGYIRLFIPYIVIANDQFRMYSNILALYGIWASRDKAERAAKEIAKQESEISKQKEHLSKIKVPDIKPYGTQGNC